MISTGGTNIKLIGQPSSSKTKSTNYYEHYQKLFKINKILEAKIVELEEEKEKWNKKIAEVSLLLTAGTYKR